MGEPLWHSSHWGAFLADVKDGRLVGVDPSPRDTDPSPILQALPDMVHGKTRVQRPMIRRGWMNARPGEGADGNRGRDNYVAVPWDEALDRIAGEITRVRASHGNEALFTGSYGWCSAGRFHHAKTQLQRFFNLVGGSTTQIHSYSYGAAEALMPHLVGTLDPVSSPSSWDGIAAETRLMICFGGIPMKNTQVEAGGAMEHTTATWLRRYRQAGGRLVNISPLLEDIDAEFDAEWIPIRPGSDTAIILAMCWTLLDEGLHDRGFLDRYCVGFDRFADYLRGETDSTAKTPAWAEQFSQVPAATMAELARRLVAQRSMISMSWSIQRAEHGEQPYWAVIALASMIGQIGLTGGGFGFGYGAEAGLGNPRRRVSNPTHQAGRNPCPSAIPVARIADMLLNPGQPYEYNGGHHVYPDTRLVYWCGGNPFHHHQDLNRLARAFQRPETIIVNECWWTASARHADIVLPATTTLERNDIGASRRDRYLIAMKKAIEPVGQARSDFDIFSDLALRFQLADVFTEGRTEADWIEFLYEQARSENAGSGTHLPAFADFWEAGFHEVALPQTPTTVFAEFRSDPVANQPRTRLHSQMDAAGPSLASKIKGREPISLNPADAALRGLQAGDIAHVWNDRGRLLAGVVLDSGLMRGVAQLATGAWFDADEALGVDLHGNPNVVTEDRGTSRLGQGATGQISIVRIEKWEGPLPEIRAYTAPE